MIDAVTFQKLKTQPETLCHGSGSEGAFSTVYEGPIPNTVVKVGRDRKSTRLNSSHLTGSRMPSSA